MGLTHKEIDERYDDIVEFSGLGEFIDNPLTTYSSGLGARLSFAIATSRTPPVLLIDEALATGDAAFRKKSEARISQMREDAGTIFMVSHSLASILESCTRAIWLDRARSSPTVTSARSPTSIRQARQATALMHVVVATVVHDPQDVRICITRSLR